MTRRRTLVRVLCGCAGVLLVIFGYLCVAYAFLIW